MTALRYLFYAVLLLITVAAPFVFPDFKTQLATLWLMIIVALTWDCLLYTSPSPRDQRGSRMPSSA